MQGGGHATRHEGNLKAFVREEGELGNASMKKGATKWRPITDVYPPIEFPIVAFMGSIILCTIEDPIGRWVGAEASSGPQTSIPAPGHIV